MRQRGTTAETEERFVSLGAPLARESSVCISTLSSMRVAKVSLRSRRLLISSGVQSPRCRLGSSASAQWGKYPSTGKPVSLCKIGERYSASDALQSLSNTPAIWLRGRNCCMPHSCAASVSAAPCGRSTSTTGISAASATAQALAISVPATPS